MLGQSALTTMTQALPTPYRKGSEHLDIEVAQQPGAPEQFRVHPYDFDIYRARYGHDPAAPAYILTVQQGTGAQPFTLTVQFDDGTTLRALSAAIGRADLALTLDAALAVPVGTDLQLGTEIVRVTAVVAEIITVERGRPGGSPAQPHAPGTPIRLTTQSAQSVDLILPVNLTAGGTFPLPTDLFPPRARLLGWTLAPSEQATGQVFRLTALLGNIAKLSWAMGHEKDTLRDTATNIQRARHTAQARGDALDRIGADLAVTRFPPRPHVVDEGTMFLLHLDGLDTNGQLPDAVELVRPSGHPADAIDASLASDGRFGGGVTVGMPGGLQVDDDPALDTGAADDLTVELFVRLSSTTNAVSVIAAKGLITAAGALNGPGWMLSTGDFRGIANNIRWSVGDAANATDLFADSPLSVDVWTHVAGVVDRAQGQIRLHVNGIEAASASLGTLASMTNSRNIEIGAADLNAVTRLPLPAVVDEVRLSRVARTHFGPVMGEIDTAYRRRLEVFRRWFIPSPANILEAINRAGPVGGDPTPFILDETDAAVGIARAGLRILPPVIATGQSIAADGRLDGTAPAELEADFPTWMMTTPAAPNLALGPGNASLMQRSAAIRIEALAALVTPGTLQVTQAYEPTAAGPASVGRQLILSHTSIQPDRLAALAHRAGFDHVTAATDHIQVTQDISALLGIDQGTAPARYHDLTVGSAAAFRLDPTATGASFNWSIIPGVAGRATFRAHPGDPLVAEEDAHLQPRLALEGLQAGIVALRGELTRGGMTHSAVRQIRIGLDRLEDGTEIDAEGRIDALSNLPQPQLSGPFDPRLLHDWDPGTVFGDEPQFTDSDQRRMLFALRETMNNLLRELQDSGAVPSELTIDRGFEDGGPDAAFANGHAVVLQHASLPPEELAAAAHNAGAALVRHDAGQVTVVAAIDPLIGIEDPASPGVPAPTDLLIGEPPATRVLSLPPDGGGRDLFWHLSEDGAGVSVDARTRPAITLTPVAPGPLGLRSVMSLRTADATQPFTFTVRLKPALVAVGANIPKDTYDFVMNVLSHFSPIGVAIDTADLRANVAELAGQSQSQLPRYTFPNFKDR